MICTRSRCGLCDIRDGVKQCDYLDNDESYTLLTALCIPLTTNIDVQLIITTKAQHGTQCRLSAVTVFDKSRCTE